jgi:hypothetical protein
MRVAPIRKLMASVLTFVGGLRCLCVAYYTDNLNQWQASLGSIGEAGADLAQVMRPSDYCWEAEACWSLGLRAMATLTV